MVEPMNAVEAIGRMILDGPGEWIGSGEQLHELASLIAARQDQHEQAIDPTSIPAAVDQARTGWPVGQLALIEQADHTGSPDTTLARWSESEQIPGSYGWLLLRPWLPLVVRPDAVTAVRPVQLVPQDARP